jgi:gluconate 2-dehydrogenase gamma chain
MGLKSSWEVVGEPIDPDSNERLFLTEHEWQTVEALTARIIPTDHDPGAKEARVVVFIDRYLSGIDYIFAAADGSGFLRLTGKFADAWRSRQIDMQRTYRQGLRDLDACCAEHFGSRFLDLHGDQQDRALEIFSGAPKPGAVDHGTREAVTTFLQGSFDQGLDFFSAICLHTRQGFYCDPVYGGNKDQVGWKTIGFPGPKSLKDTMDGTYDTHPYFEQQYDWNELIPHLAGSEWARSQPPTVP